MTQQAFGLNTAVRFLFYSAICTYMYTVGIVQDIRVHTCIQEVPTVLIC